MEQSGIAASENSVPTCPDVDIDTFAPVASLDRWVYIIAIYAFKFDIICLNLIFFVSDFDADGTDRNLVP